jgi:hypothetical protein
MRFSFLCMILSISVFPAQAQLQSSTAKAGKGTIYFGMGFHRVFFTNSDIHFHDEKTGNYNFTLYKVRAKDDNDFSVGKGFDAPQYSFRLGYYFKNKPGIGIEFSFDHVKYIAIQDQKLHVSGQINGVKLDKDTVLTKDFVEYEHTDGANYYMFNFIRRKQILHSESKKHWLSFTVKPGLGFVLPRTDSRIMGKHRDDTYHLAGYVVGIETGLRYDFLRYFFADAGVRGAYANYMDVQLYGKGRASQHWWSLQTIIIAGFQFPL